MSKLIKSRISDLNKTIAGLKDKEVRVLLKAEATFIRDNYKLTTARGYFTFYNAGIDFDKESTRKAFRMTKLEQSKIEKASDKAVFKKTSNVVTIKNVSQYLSKANDLLESKDVYEVAIGVMALTGRRSIEVMKMARFNLVGKNLHLSKFKGQAKKNPIDIDKGYNIYILNMNVKRIQKALAFIRAELNFKNMTNAEVTSKVTNKLIHRVNKHFQDYLGYDLTTHSLRAVYAGICLANFFNPHKYTVSRFLFDLLGHAEDDIDTANKYQKFYCKEKIFFIRTNFKTI